jgi:hypothetical protein
MSTSNPLLESLPRAVVAGVEGGGDAERIVVQQEGRGRDPPNGNPNKERQLLENGKLIPIMIPSK